MNVQKLAQAARSATHVYLGKFNKTFTDDIHHTRYQAVEATDKVDAVRQLNKEAEKGELLTRIYLELN